jgi:hypothetical protein
VSYPADARDDEQSSPVEVIFELTSGADDAVLQAWLGQRDLRSTPLVGGLLVTGSRGGVRAAFGAEPTGMLPVPEELAEHVVSIVVAPPKQLHSAR